MTGLEHCGRCGTWNVSRGFWDRLMWVFRHRCAPCVACGGAGFGKNLASPDYVDVICQVCGGGGRKRAPLPRKAQASEEGPGC